MNAHQAAGRKSISERIQHLHCQMYTCVLLVDAHSALIGGVERLFNSSLGSDPRRWQKDTTGRCWSGTWRGGGATLSERRAEFDNTHYVLLSSSYLGPAGKAYGMEFCPLARIQAAEKLLLSTFLQRNCIFSTTLVAPLLYDDGMHLLPIVFLGFRNYFSELSSQHVEN